MTPERAQEHDERCEQREHTDNMCIHCIRLFNGAPCGCAERALTQLDQDYRAFIKTAEAHSDALRAENDRLTLAASESARTLQVEIMRLKDVIDDKGSECERLRIEHCRRVVERAALQARIAELEAGEQHCDEYHGELADQVTALQVEIERLKREREISQMVNQPLCDACRSPQDGA